MDRQDAVEMLDYLSSLWPRQYSPNMTEQRKLNLLDTFLELFDASELHEVKTACKQLLKVHDEAPTVSMILNRCQLGRQEERITQESRANRTSLSGLPEDHPWRGCYTHHEAFVACMEDMKKGLVEVGFGCFPEYVKRYPAIKWHPWANPALNRDRWPYITADNFGGWTTDENCFCIPYTK